MGRSILSRKRDLFYLVFFSLHVPIMLLVDMTTIYPPSLTPAICYQIRDFQLKNYKDLFFVSPPDWFVLYIWMELTFHVPVSIWSIRALLADSPKVPLVLLIFACQTAVTTATCIAEYLSWESLSFPEKMNLTTVYGPYLALAVFMGVDMVARLNGMIDAVVVRDGRIVDVASAPGSEKKAL